MYRYVPVPPVPGYGTPSEIVSQAMGDGAPVGVVPLECLDIDFVGIIIRIASLRHAVAFGSYTSPYSNADELRRRVSEADRKRRGGHTTRVLSTPRLYIPGNLRSQYLAAVTSVQHLHKSLHTSGRAGLSTMHQVDSGTLSSILRAATVSTVFVEHYGARATVRSFLDFIAGVRDSDDSVSAGGVRGDDAEQIDGVGRDHDLGRDAEGQAEGELAADPTSVVHFDVALSVPPTCHAAGGVGSCMVCTVAVSGTPLSGEHQHLAVFPYLAGGNFGIAAGLDTSTGGLTATLPDVPLDVDATVDSAGRAVTVSKLMVYSQLWTRATGASDAARRLRFLPKREGTLASRLQSMDDIAAEVLHPRACQCAPLRLEARLTVPVKLVSTALFTEWIAPFMTLAGFQRVLRG